MKNVSVNVFNLDPFSELLVAMLVRIGCSRKKIICATDDDPAVRQIRPSSKERIIFLSDSIIGGHIAEQWIKELTQEFPCLIIAHRQKRHLSKRIFEIGIQEVLQVDDISVNLLRKTMFNAIERHRLRKQLREISLIDSLTGIYNHRGFFSYAEQAIHLAIRLNTPVYLMYLDLDHMKWINDSWGHEEGDYILREAALLLTASFRQTDIVGRLGGDEFAVLSIQGGDDGEEAMLKRLNHHLLEKRKTWGKTYPLSFSIGLAHCNKPDKGILSKLLAEADSEMYKNKTNRRGQPPVDL